MTQTSMDHICNQLKQMGVKVSRIKKGEAQRGTKTV